MKDFKTSLSYWVKFRNYMRPESDWKKISNWMMSREKYFYRFWKNISKVKLNKFRDNLYRVLKILNKIGLMN